MIRFKIYDLYGLKSLLKAVSSTNIVFIGFILLEVKLIDYVCSFQKGRK